MSWSNRPRSAALIVAVFGLLAGLVFGYASAPETAREKTTDPPPPRYELPALAKVLVPEYRAAVQETGDLVRTVLDSYPDSTSAVVALARLHRLAHNRTGEMRCWQRVLELSPDNRLAYSRLVQLAEQDGDYAQIVQCMRHALEVHPGDAGYTRQLAKALIYTRRYAEARRILDVQRRQGRAGGESYLILGQACEQLGQLRQAARDLEAAVLLLPDRSDALYSLASVYGKLGRTDDAARVAGEFEKLKQAQRDQESRMVMPDDMQDKLVVPRRLAAIITAVGQAYAERGRMDRAVECYVRAARVSPRDTRSRELLSAFYNQTGQLEQALERVRELRKIAPENMIHYRNEGILNAEMGNSAEAERVFHDLIDRAPRKPLGYAPLAELYLKEHRRLADAKTLAETAVNLEPSPPHFELLMAIAREMGDVNTARQAIERALELDATNPEYLKAYESLAPHR